MSVIHPRGHRRWTGSIAAVAILAVASVAACSGGGDKRYSSAKLEASLAQVEQPGVVLGEFTLHRKAVVDGDTIKVDGLPTSLRLLAIDTEETFKKKADKRLFADGWEGYVQAMQGDKRKPAKYATPLGEDAKRFADEFFAGVRTVRLERDHPKDIRGRYDRYLAYVLVQRDGAWVNYNVECVRAGMSPYFTKYGYSRRYHDELVAAQDEARAARRGIWDPTRQHYPDYEQRLAWWNQRAEFVRQFEDEARDQPNYITLTHWDALTRLEEHIDREVVLLATVGDVRVRDKGPTRVMLSRKINNDFPLIFFDRAILGESQIADYRGEFVRVRGPVNVYKNKYNQRRTLQIIVELPGQVTGYLVPGITDAPTTATATESKAP